MTVFEIFEFSVNPLELVLRGTLIYLGLVLVLRFLLRRDVGSMSVADVLFIVLVADAAQNAMSGQYETVSDGAVLVATLVGWNMMLDWLSYRSRGFRRFIEPPSLALIQDGKLIRKNLKQQWITAEELMSKLREKGIDDLSIVRVACLEPSGEIGIIRNDRASLPDSSKRIVGTT